VEALDDGEMHWLRLWREGEVIRVINLRPEPGKDSGDGGTTGDGRAWQTLLATSSNAL
jgi:hypothetical protein